MKIFELMAILRLQDKDAEVEIICDNPAEEYFALKIWAHPESPDSAELNQIVIR